MDAVQQYRHSRELAIAKDQVKWEATVDENNHRACIGGYELRAYTHEKQQWWDLLENNVVIDGDEANSLEEAKEACLSALVTHILK